MSVETIRTVLLIAVALIAVALVLAAGSRVIAWIVGAGAVPGVLKAAATLIVGALGGAGAITALRNGRNGQ